MNEIFSTELESKKLSELITQVYHVLYEDHEILIPPDNDNGLFKYIGMSPQANYEIAKISKRRESQRVGLGFVIQRAVLPGRLRVKMDIEISDELTRRNSQTLFDNMNSFAIMEQGGQAVEFILYHQPAFSGKRSWSEKIFIGLEFDVQEKEFKNLERLEKRMVDHARRLFQALDHALTSGG